MRNLLICLILAATPAFGAITPGTVTANDPNDPLFAYQWSLKASGQKGRREFSDIRSVEIQASPQASINWTPALAGRMSRDVIVAVLDSGLDVDHDDIKNQIAKNTADCSEDGRIPLNPQTDNDNNGFRGDCMGWSFVTANGANRFTDRVGHGTFVAGVIAAEVNNSIGIAGLGSRIKILPIQVYDDAEGRQSASGRPVLTDRMARAIDYAVSRGAKVINISMGWPGLLHRTNIIQALERAASRGVLIVAGAGNDSHNAPVFPCATTGVLCVGSIDMDTELSDFSNYGGHVDIYGPGKAVVSTWPTTLFTFFGPRGYEEKSGTSFAAPYVAGSAALLMGIYPNESAGQIRARLLTQARMVTAPSGKVLPLLNVQAAAQGSATLVHPEFKSEDVIQVNPSSLAFEMTLKIQNIGAARTASISVSSPSHPNALRATSLSPSLTQGVNTMTLRGRLQSRNESSFLTLRVRIGNRTYENVRVLSLDLRGRGQQFQLPSDKSLQTVPTFPVAQNQPEYFYSEKVEGQGVKLSVIKLAGNGQTVKSEVMIPRASNLLNDSFPIQKVDINLDGRPDYISFSVINNAQNQPEHVQVSYLNENLQALYPNSIGMQMPAADAIPHLSRLSYVITNASFGRQRVPIFWTQGMIPEADANTNPFDFEENELATRLYYIDGAQVRMLTNHAFNDSIKRLKDIVFPDELLYHGMVTQNVSGFEQGQGQLLASVGQGVNREYFTIQISSFSTTVQASQIKIVNMGDRDLQLQTLIPNIELNQGREDTGFSIVGLFSNTLARVLNFALGAAGLGVTQDVRLQMPDEADPLNSILQIFSINGRSTVAIATDTKVGFYDVQTQSLKQNLIYRFTYLPGRVLAPRYVPVIAGRSGSAAPGLFVDNSLWSAPQAIVWSLNGQGRMDVQVKHSMQVPAGCAALNPTRYQSDSVFAMQCQNRLYLSPIE